MLVSDNDGHLLGVRIHTCHGLLANMTDVKGFPYKSWNYNESVIIFMSDNLTMHRGPGVDMSDSI